MPARPVRVKVKNELGISTTLPVGEQYLQVFGHGAGLLVLCPGPDPRLVHGVAGEADPVYLLDVPAFAGQMPLSWAEAIPREWRHVDMDEALRMLPHVRVVQYTPAGRLFPSIFAPLVARALFTGRFRASCAHRVLLPAPVDGLLVSELAGAVSARGLIPVRLPATVSPDSLRDVVHEQGAALFLSVNFHGLDPYGANQAVLEAAGVPVAAWCVDNPFHLLTAQKSRMWMRLALFVTDEWFVAPLAELGARVRHLPLATDLTVFPPGEPCPAHAALTFVGRSRFPRRDRFFAASSVPAEVRAAASALPGREAHFGWWSRQLGVQSFWPGNAVRAAGLGAELASEDWRVRCLRAMAGRVPLRIVGDDAWSDLVPEAVTRPPVDYYAGLAEIYRAAPFSLNLTSLLLPHGLTQRHFDVWACGGFLLTDDTPGLRIFPDELVRAVRFSSPEEGVELTRSLVAAPARREALRRAWQELVTREHTYAARLAAILDVCGLAVEG